jgi:hypothetical protein
MKQKVMSWRILPIVIVVGCLVLAAVVSRTMLAARAAEDSTPRWNDSALLVDAQGQPRGGEYVVVPDASDQAYSVAKPSAAEIAKCLEWLGRFIAPAALPRDVGSHLLAFRDWPKCNGDDVFVTWYTADDSLIQIVEGNRGVTVVKMPLNDQPGVAPEQHVDFAIRTAETLLTSAVQPNPVRGVQPYPVRTTGITEGAWSAAALTIKREGENLWSAAMPTSETAETIGFHTDGRSVRFDIGKAYPGSRNPNAARFEPTSTPPAPHPPTAVPPPPSGTEPIHISNSISDEDLAHEVSPEGLKDE